MTRYLVQPRDQIFVKGYGILSFGKNVSKNLSGEYSHEILDHAKQSARDAPKPDSKREIHKTVKSTGDLKSNEIAKKITKDSSLIIPPQSNSETVTNEVENTEFDREIPKYIYTYICICIYIYWDLNQRPLNSVQTL